MKIHFLIPFLLLSLLSFSQWDCYYRIDSIIQTNDSVDLDLYFYNNIETHNCQTEILELYFLGQMYFFQNKIDSLEVICDSLIAMVDSEDKTMYTERRFTGFLCMLLVEEFRWQKNKEKFMEWRTKFTSMISFYKCGNSLFSIIYKARAYMRTRFKRAGDMEGLNEFEKRRKKRNNKFRNIRRCSPRYFYYK
ncbi:MAG: hypothetical protein AB8B72_05015 [Crocinitomicaceae bacterium]